jgi:cation transport regulator ChaB
MPTQSAPETLRGHAAAIWVAAFNSAWDGKSCKDDCAAPIAWAAVKKKYTKNKEGRWVAKEDTPRNFIGSDIFPATEAEFDDDSLSALVTLVRPGVSKNRKNWKPEALRLAVESGIFNGSKMFVSHSPNPQNRTLHELMSAVESTTLGDDGRVIGRVNFIDEAFYSKAKRAKEHFGTSIDVLFRGMKVKGRDGNAQWDADEIVKVNSVDWVPFPAAGGGIDRFLNAQESEEDVDWEALTLDDIQKNRPDLIPAAKEEAQGDGGAPPTPPVGTLTPDQIRDEVRRAVEAERTSWEGEASKRSSVRRQIEEKISAAALPQRTRTRLVHALEGGTEFDEAKVTAAIAEAQEELKEAGFKPRMKGMGTSEAGDSKLEGEAAQEAVREAAPVHMALAGAFQNTRAQEAKK